MYWNQGIKIVRLRGLGACMRARRLMGKAACAMPCLPADTTLPFVLQVTEGLAVVPVQPWRMNGPLPPPA